MSVLVLGIGNVLLRDEGIGIRAIRELDRRYCFSGTVEILDGGTAGLELLGHIRNRDHLLIIDALKTGQRPGTVVRAAGEEVIAAFRTRISPHQLGLSDLLAAAVLTDEMPRNLVLFGVEPEKVETGLELTSAVEGCLDKLLAAVVDELRAIGCSVSPVAGDFSQRAVFWETGDQVHYN